MKKLKDLLNESVEIGKVYSNPYAKSFVKEEEEERPRAEKLTTEQKQAFLEAVKGYKAYGESVYRKEGLTKVYESIRGLVEVANKVTLSETGDWFDGVTVGRHMKRMNESFKVFEKTLKEVSTLQQRLESSYDEIGEVLGKYYEINETEEMEEGNEFGAARAKAIANGDDSFEVDGKKYPVKDVDKDDKENAKEFTKESMKLTDMIKKPSVNEIKKGSVVIPYAMDKHGEFIVDKVFKNKDGETSYTGKFKKNGEHREFILHSKDRIVKESVNEGASSEEKRIVMLAVRKISKYRNVPINQSVVDVQRAAEELERDIQKGKVK